jgi:hypothetical protein
LLFFADELAANAVTHTRSGKPGGLFTVEVAWSPNRARVVVGDQGSDEIPASKPATDDDAADVESGRGLLLIDAMSVGWGIAGDAGARWLWADVHWRSRGGPLPTALGDDCAAQQLAALSRAYPGTAAWYESQSGQWCATVPATTAGGKLNAPSPAALAHLLKAHCPECVDAHFLMAAVQASGAATSQRTVPHRIG